MPLGKGEAPYRGPREQIFTSQSVNKARDAFSLFCLTVYSKGLQFDGAVDASQGFSIALETNLSVALSKLVSRASSANKC